MGDSGAMFLGLALATLAGVGGAKLATMLLLLGLPILDAARVIVRRIRRGHTPLHADRSHLHHRLLAIGLSQRQVTLLFYAVTGGFGAVTILAAYLQAHAWQWSSFLRLTPWLNIATTEAPTILGLLLVPIVTLSLWALIRRRRKRLGLPPDSSISGLYPPQSLQPPQSHAPLVSSGGRHTRPL
jgi:hypothetical protein